MRDSSDFYQISIFQDGIFKESKEIKGDENLNKILQLSPRYNSIMANTIEWAAENTQ